MKKVYNFGINDVDYKTQVYTGDKGDRKITWTCPIYRRWKFILRKCLTKQIVGYEDCCISDKWARLSDFKMWLESNPDWKDLEIDKDILIKGNREYGPDTCVLVPSWINSLIVTRSRDRGEYPIGVHFVKDKRCTKDYPKPYFSQLRTGDGNREYLGVFETPQEAHRAWQLAKYNQIIKTEERYKKFRNFYESVVVSLLSRAEKIKNDYEQKIETLDF